MAAISSRFTRSGLTGISAPVLADGFFGSPSYLVIQEDIQLSRAINGTIHAIRRPSDEEIPPPGSGHYFAEGAGRAGGAAIDPGYAGGIYVWGGLYDLTYREETDDYIVYFDWSTRAVVKGDPWPGFDPPEDWKATHSERVGSYVFSSEEYAIHGGIPETVAFNHSASFSVTVSGTFKLVAAFTGIYVPKPLIWQEYGFDHDPFGLSPERIDFWLVPTSPISVAFTGPGCSWAQTIDASNYGDDQAAFEEAFKYGFGWMDARSDPSGMGDLVYLDEPELVAEMTLTGMGGQGEGGSAELNDGSNILNWSATTGVYRHRSTGWPNTGGIPCGGIIWKYAPHNKTYAGTIRHADESNANSSTQLQITEVDGPEYENPDPDHITLTGINPNRTVHYDGWWLLWGIDDSEEHKELYNFGQYSCHGLADSGGILNVPSIDEPAYPNTAEVPPGPDDSYSDRRVEIAPALSNAVWSDALKFTIPTTTDVFTFDSAEGWTVDPPGAAVLSMQEGKLQVAVAEGQNDVSISRNVEFTCCGYRFADCKHTSDDAEAIEISLDSRTWEVKADAYLMDLINPANAGAESDVNQHVMEDGSATWGWGVHDVGALSIGQLRGGKTYTFERLQCRRAPEDGGFIGVYVPEVGAFVADVAGDSRMYDLHGLYPQSLPTNRTKINRQAVVIVDGVVGAEIRGPKHYIPPTGNVLHYCTALNDEDVIHPKNTHLRMKINEHPDWRLADRVTALLVGGWRSGYDSVTVPVQLKAIQLSIPAAIGGQAVQIAKRFRGRIAVRVVDPDGTFQPRTVTVDTRHSLGGAIVESQAFQTSKVGWGKSGALKQPLDGDNYIHTVWCYNSLGEKIEATVETRNRAWTFVTLRGTAPAVGGGAVSTDKEPAGRIYLAYCDGDVYVQRSDDYGVTWDAASPATSEGGNDSVAISAMWVANYQQLCVIYHKTSAGQLAKRYSTTEGRTWGDEVVLFDGTHPYIYRDPSSDLKCLFYVVAGNTLYVRRSMDNFATWLGDAEIVALDTADETPSAQPAGGRENKVVLVYKNTSGQLVKVLSHANGAPPYT